MTPEGTEQYIQGAAATGCNCAAFSEALEMLPCLIADVVQRQPSAAGDGVQLQPR